MNRFFYKQLKLVQEDYDQLIKSIDDKNHDDVGFIAAMISIATRSMIYMWSENRYIHNHYRNSRIQRNL